MKTKILFTTILLTFYFSLLISVTYAQWEWQNPLPQGNSLNDVAFLDGNTGWAVGYFGTILFTDNGGENWENHQTGIRKNLNSICFIDDQKGWIVGDEGLILHTSNSGLDWMEQSSETFQSLNECCFLDANFGWAVGDTGVILITVNGGEDWEIQNNPTNLNLKSVCFTDPLNGWISGADFTTSVILHSNDGGINWIEQNTPSTEASLVSICFTDSLKGWVAGYHGYNGWDNGVMLHTNDGGNNWEWQGMIYGGLTSVYFQDSLNGWAVGENILWGSSQGGFIICTHNGGENWVSSYSGCFDRGLSAFSHVDNNKFAVGKSGVIVRSVDSDTNWIDQSNAVTVKPLKDVLFTDQNYGWAVGGYRTSGTSWGTKTRGVILNTSDGGNTWIDKIDDSLKFINLSSIYCLNENMIWTAGHTYVAAIGGMSYRMGHVFFSGDGGNTWSHQYNGIDSVINTVHFVDDQNGWAVGYIFNDYNDFSGLIFKTNNGGADWSVHLSETSNWFGDIFFINESVGWISKSNGIILHTSNGGENWEEQTSGISEELGEIIFTDNDNGWVIGSNFICHTTDAGDTWEESISGEDWGLSAIHFTDMQNGWAVGDHIILFTQNGGISWEVYDEMLTDQLSRIWFTDSDNGWVVGNGGRILHTSNGGLTEISKVKIPDSNLHLTNYPNPFNSKTTIEFSIQEKSFVTVSVYDLSSKLQEKVISKNLTSGKHQFEWNADGLPTGIYLLRLETNGTIITKKLLLMR